MQTSPKGNLHRLNAGFVIYSPFSSSCTNAQNTAKIGFIPISIFPEFPDFSTLSACTSPVITAIYFAG